MEQYEHFHRLVMLRACAELVAFGAAAAPAADAGKSRHSQQISQQRDTDVCWCLTILISIPSPPKTLANLSTAFDLPDCHANLCFASHLHLHLHHSPPKPALPRIAGTCETNGHN